MTPIFKTLDELKEAIRENNRKYRPNGKWNPEILGDVIKAGKLAGKRAPKGIFEYPEGIDWQVENALEFPVKVFYFWTEYSTERKMVEMPIPILGESVVGQSEEEIPCLNLSLNSFEVQERPQPVAA